MSYTLTSWDFFLATLAIYGTSWVLQVARTLWTSARGLPYTLEVLPDHEMVRVAVTVPARFAWTPGQHVFLRFVSGAGLHALSTHPFTIANVPEEVVGGTRTLEVIFRVRGGITRALRDMAARGAAGRVLVDGPYGGPPSLGGFDRVCLLAGGTGASSSSARFASSVLTACQARPSRSRSLWTSCADTGASTSSSLSPCGTSVSPIQRVPDPSLTRSRLAPLDGR